MAPKNFHFQAFYLLHTLIRLFSFNYSSEAGGGQIESPSLLLLLLLIDQRQHFTNLAFHFTFIYCGSRSTRSFASLVWGGLSSSGTRVCHDRRHNSPTFMSASHFLHRALSSRDSIDVSQRRKFLSSRETASRWFETNRDVPSLHIFPN